MTAFRVFRFSPQGYREFVRVEFRLGTDVDHKGCADSREQTSLEGITVELRKCVVNAARYSSAALP